MTKFLAACAVLVLTAPTLAAGSSTNPFAQDVGKPVKTSSGTVVGHAATIRNQVSEYLGIPFAKPPLGKLRFAAPQRFKGNGTINASKYVR